jgi:hypothetical protein
MVLLDDVVEVFDLTNLSASSESVTSIGVPNTVIVLKKASTPASPYGLRCSFRSPPCSLRFCR